ncbi:LLM class flavin-dependent oxidoreductase [Streptomyces sp. NPDC058247]|uniref:LLM class flavin-dependent oxidoreductase n=1 Tax=Streptomyces sp. NPDC058247 TaxID=3346401 RepID=UPI0036EA57AE
MRLNAIRGGRRFPLSAPTASKHGADINVSSPGGAWWTSDRRSISDVMARAREIEDLGYASLSCGEAGGREFFTQTAALLGGTERLVVGTGISSARERVGQGPPGCVRLPTWEAAMPAPGPDDAPCQERGRVQTDDARPHLTGYTRTARGGARGAATAQATRALGVICAVRHVRLPLLKRDIVVARRRRSRSSHARA